ncbi:bacterial Ig-like domain-containing protein [Agrilactobacillus yilanensis]|uniref:Bacterial Ig-like domain-containing protein n=1 Tax=Agrilactobacillus yilanensis TaxID=2485997 RepID=A0ABW4J7B3_9LACO|nr:bacterial Ig-like domain-containing protein [Agrilactobacillus yilanensis]
MKNSTISKQDDKHRNVVLISSAILTGFLLNNYATTNVHAATTTQTEQTTTAATSTSAETEETVDPNSGTSSGTTVAGQQSTTTTGEGASSSSEINPTSVTEDINTTETTGTTETTTKSTTDTTGTDNNLENTSDGSTENNTDTTGMDAGTTGIAATSANLTAGTDTSNTGDTANTTAGGTTDTGITESATPADATITSTAEETTETTADETATTDSTVTAPVLDDKFPTLANLYVEPSQNAVGYGQTITLKVMPYNTNMMSAQLGNQLYGFYIVLPTTITGNTTSFQTSADDFVASFNGDNATYTNLNITSLTVSQLSNTTDGREVYYFRPNDGAVVAESNKVKPILTLSVTTGSDAADTPSYYQLNANTNDEVTTNDVLFAGVNDMATNTNKSYTPILATDVGITDAPDQYITGIAYSGINRFIGYTGVHTQDSVVTQDTDWQAGDNFVSATGAKDRIVTAPVTDASQMAVTITKDGTTVDRVDTTQPGTYKVTYSSSAGSSTATVTVSGIQVQDSNLTQGGTWAQDDNLVKAIDGSGITVGSDALVVSITKDGQSVNNVDTSQPGVYAVTYQLTDGTNAGKTATVVVSGIALSQTETTVTQGDQWTPSDNFTQAIDKDGQNVDLADLTVTITDATGATVDQVNTAEPGTYTVTYTLPDGSVSQVATITVTAKDTDTDDNTGNGDDNDNDNGNSNNNNGNNNNNNGNHNSGDDGGVTTPTEPENPDTDPDTDIDDSDDTTDNTGDEATAENPDADHDLDNTGDEATEDNTDSDTTSKPNLDTSADNDQSETNDVVTDNSNFGTNSGQEMITQAPTATASNQSNIVQAATVDTNTQATDAKTFPQTGEKQSNQLTILGAVLVVLSGLLGWIGYKKQQKKTRKI